MVTETVCYPTGPTSPATWPAASVPLGNDRILWTSCSCSCCESSGYQGASAASSAEDSGARFSSAVRRRDADFGMRAEPKEVWSGMAPWWCTQIAGGCQARRPRTTSL